MRIAHVVATFPPHTGGMGEVALAECKSLHKKGHKVEVFTLKYKNFDYSQDKDFDFKINRIKPLLKFGDGGIVFLAKKLKDFDLVHLHYPFYGSAQCVFWAKKFFKTKYVVTYHMDGQVKNIKKILRNIYDFIFAKAIFKNAEKIIYVDKNNLKKLKYTKYNDKNKLEYLPHGIDTDIFKPGNTDLAYRPPADKAGQAGLNHDRKTILFVGNFLRVKRVDLLIEAVEKIKDLNPLVLLVGSGYEEENLKKLVKNKNLENIIKFEGRCFDKKKLANYYNLADCTVVSGSYESFSLVLVESMACGTPVISSDISELQSKIEDKKDGFLFKSGSAEDLSLKLRQFFNLKEEKREDLGIRARKKIIENFSLDKHMESLESLYKNIL